MTAFEDVFDDEMDDFSDLVTEWGEIGARLRAPREVLDLEAFAAGLRCATLTWRMAGWSKLVGDHGLPGRLRGTFGNVLAEAASSEALDGHPCRWHPPCTFEALFRKQGRLTAGTDFPSPWLIGCDARRGDLDVSLVLFGMAMEWLPAAAEAFSTSLRRVDRLSPKGPFVSEARILERRLSVGEQAMEVPPPGRAMILDTLSPFVSSGDGAASDPVALFTTLGRRLEGMARWQEATLDVDFRAVADDLRAADWRWSACEEVRWWRGSRRQGGRAVPMAGVVGRLAVAADADRLQRLVPLFRLAEIVRVGADIAFGCGRFRLSFVD